MIGDGKCEFTMMPSNTRDTLTSLGRGGIPIHTVVVYDDGLNTLGMVSTFSNLTGGRIFYNDELADMAESEELCGPRRRVCGTRR
jgi:hypothetical protein